MFLLLFITLLVLIVASLGGYFPARFTVACFLQQSDATTALKLAGRIGGFSQVGEDRDGKDHRRGPCARTIRKCTTEE